MNIYEQSHYLELAAELKQRELNWKEKLAYLGSDFLQRTQVECPVEHIFKDGQYCREMRIPAGTLFIGRPHKLGHTCLLTQGSVVHFTEREKIQRDAVYELRSVPGYQVVIFAITDVVGQTWHPDDGERDIDKLEERIFESKDSFKELGLAVRRALEAA